MAARFSLWQGLASGLLAALLDIALGAYRYHALLAGDLLNPDSYMRLARLDDILAAHAPIDAVARDASGTGTVLHWSHLLDSLLLLMAAPLAPLLGEHAALHGSGLLLGPLSAGVLGVALAWAAAPLSDPEWRWTAALVGILAVAILGYASLGVVHHHILVALSAVMCAGWAGRAGGLGAQAGRRLGIWAAFGLWLSPEAMPVALMAFGAIGVGWLIEPRRPSWSAAAAAATTSFALLTALALSADPPTNVLPAALDRLSIAWLVFALLGACVGRALVLIDRCNLGRARRTLVGSTIAVLAAIIWLALFPAALGGAEGIENAGHLHAFDAISEMRPITSPGDATLYLSQGLFALVIAAILTVRRRSWLFGYATFCLLLLLTAAVLHRRFSTYAAGAGAVAVPVGITMISAALRGRPALCGMLARVSLLLSLIAAPLLPTLIAGRAAADAITGSSCSIRKAAAVLRPLVGEVVLADVNDSPELLYRTRLRTVGSLYHRDPDAFLRLRDAWRSTGTEHIPVAVAATGASLVLFCRNDHRTPMVADLPADTLWDRLMRKDVPAWLHELRDDEASGFTLFRVEQSPAANKAQSP